MTLGVMAPVGVLTARVGAYPWWWVLVERRGVTRGDWSLIIVAVDVFVAVDALVAVCGAYLGMLVR